MARRPYKPSFTFLALGSGILVLILGFFTLPSLALLWATPAPDAQPFPVSVDLKNKLIVPEGGSGISLGSINLASVFYALGDGTELVADAIMATRIYSDLMSASAPQSFTITPGMRKEQVADVLTESLGWSKSQKQIFLDMNAETTAEGTLYPSTYVVHASTTPAEAYAVIKERFDLRVMSRYTSAVAEAVPIEDALAIASIIEREAGTTAEMRIIAGIFWNRIFIDMKLQADSTLQYARGTARNGWWPVPRSRDKFIASPYNTYLHLGLPPTPIANPSVDAIMAVLNPAKTDCLFFFHAKQKFYCSPTYEEHVQKLTTIYGRGR